MSQGLFNSFFKLAWFVWTWKNTKLSIIKGATLKWPSMTFSEIKLYDFWILCFACFEGDGKKYKPEMQHL